MTKTGKDALAEIIRQIQAGVEARPCGRLAAGARKLERDGLVTWDGSGYLLTDAGRAAAR